MTELVGRVERVIVVGAGIAGLAAASRLRRAGIEYVVLEARDRIGGRLHTIDLAGVPVDLGGSWIHHPIGITAEPGTLVQIITVSKTGSQGCRITVDGTVVVSQGAGNAHCIFTIPER